MLNTWLKPVTVTDFHEQYLRKRPLARPNTAEEVIPLFSWETLDCVLSHATADVLVVAAGKLVELPPPRTVAELRVLFQHGIGIVVRRAEREDPALARLAGSFARDLGAEAHIQLFVTPAGTHGFGWHYDREDVFIAQTCGGKDYFFRQNTVCPDVLHASLDFEPFRRENSPVGTATLIAGDWLYIPAGWWHMAKCTEDSLSISIGVLLRSGRTAVSR